MAWVVSPSRNPLFVGLRFVESWVSFCGTIFITFARRCVNQYVKNIIIFELFCICVRSYFLGWMLSFAHLKREYWGKVISPKIRLFYAHLHCSCIFKDVFFNVKETLQNPIKSSSIGLYKFIFLTANYCKSDHNSTVLKDKLKQHVI